MASPFVHVATRLGENVAPLDVRAQALFFACAGKVLWPADLEREPPEDAPIAAQDAWICADIALRLPRGEFRATDGMWYVLEPKFQATCERLFGFSDVGSEREQEDEARALEDPALAAAVTGVEAALEHLRAVGVPGDADADATIRHLLPLRP